MIISEIPMIGEIILGLVGIFVLFFWFGEEL